MSDHQAAPRAQIIIEYWDQTCTMTHNCTYSQTSEAGSTTIISPSNIQESSELQNEVNSS